MNHLSLRLGVVAALVFCSLTMTRLAQAEDDESEEPPPKARPTPPEFRSFRPTFGGHIGMGRPAGSAEEGLRLPNAAPWGYLPGFEIRLPVSRHVSLEGFGNFGQFKGGTGVCPKCSLSTTLFGGGVVYHLLDGVPLDPWLSFGAGYRTTKVTFDGVQSLQYGGLEPVRIAMGMDRYVLPQVGLGLYADLTFGEFSKREPGPFRDDRVGAIHTFFSFGIRGVLSPFASF